MTDVLGWRRTFGVLGPSTNTIVQPDFDAMRPFGVTNHYSRIFTPDANAVSNESFRAGTEIIAENVLDAVRRVDQDGVSETVTWRDRVPVERIFDVAVAPLKWPGQRNAVAYPR